MCVRLKLAKPRNMPMYESNCCNIIVMVSIHKCHWCQAVDGEIANSKGIFCDTQCQAEDIWADRFPNSWDPRVPQGPTDSHYAEWIKVKKMLRPAQYLKPGCCTFEQKIISLLNLGGGVLYSTRKATGSAALSQANVSTAYVTADGVLTTRKRYSVVTCTPSWGSGHSFPLEVIFKGHRQLQ